MSFFIPYRHTYIYTLLMAFLLWPIIERIVYFLWKPQDRNTMLIFFALTSSLAVHYGLVNMILLEYANY